MPSALILNHMLMLAISTGAPALETARVTLPGDHDIRVMGSAPGASMPPVDRRVATAQEQVLLIDLHPVTPDMALEAARLTRALHDLLPDSIRLLSLADIPPQQDIQASMYWETCPEKLECLLLMGERSGASKALMGEVYRRRVEKETVQTADSMDTTVIQLRLVDVKKSEELAPLLIEVVGQDEQSLIEAVSLALARPMSPSRRPQTLEPDDEEGPTLPDGVEAEVLVTPAQRLARGEAALRTARNKRMLERGHGGQLLVRLSAGAMYGEAGQEYISQELTRESGVVEQYSRLSLSPGAAVGLQGALGFGIGRYLEIEGRLAWTSTSTRLQLYSEDALIYDLDPWTQAECSGSGKDGCPRRVTVGSSALSVGGRARVFTSIGRAFRPFLIAGATWRGSSGVEEDAANAGVEVEPWWERYDPIQTLSATAGAGVQYDLNNHLGLFVQLPLSWRVWTTQSAGHERHYQQGEGPFFQDLPAGQTLAFPLSAELEAGLQLRFF